MIHVLHTSSAPIIIIIWCTAQAETVLKECVDCGREFRTYVPETMCILPDGGSVFYNEPQTKCPLCDVEGYGGFMNKDLFTELTPGP